MENIISTKNRILLKLLNFFCYILCKKEVGNDDFHITDCKKVLIISYSLLGDAVMLLPFIQTIKEKVPEVQITIVCDNSSATIFSRHSNDLHIISSTFNTLFSSPIAIIKNLRQIKKLLSRINQNTYDVAIEPRGDLRFILFMSKINVSNRISYGSTGGTYLLTKTISPYRNSHHIIDFEFHILNELGINTTGKNKIPTLLRNGNDISFLNNFFTQYHLQRNSYLTGIHPGASRLIKQWPYYCELIIKLYSHRPNQTFLLFQGPDEELVIKKLAVFLDERQVSYLIVKENLDNYISVLSCCNQIICNDSGAGHIAAAYGIPVTVIFGPTIPEVGLPHSTNQVNAVSHIVSCKPCYQSSCKLRTQLCMYSIHADEVFEKSKEGRYLNREYINL